MTTSAVVFGFAVPDGLVPVVGAAPYDVLARQLPRQLVQQLNGTEDRGARFFPFLGTLDGRRSFLRVRELQSPEALRALPQCEPGTLIVDGVIESDHLRVRMHDGQHAEPRFAAELPFDPRAPFEPLPRLQFEVATLLGWTGRPAPLPDLQGTALAWYLVAKDRLLALEAGILDQDDPLRAVREIAAAAPESPLVHEVAIETAAQCARRGHARAEAAQVLQAIGAGAAVDARLAFRIGSLLQALEDEAAALPFLVRAAESPEATSAMAESAAGLLFRRGDLATARDLLLGVRERGELTVAGQGQLAAIADRLGDRDLRDRLVGELLPREDLPPPVARVVISFLCEQEEYAAARDVAARAARRHEGDPTLWLELGRTALMVEDGAAALAALERAVARGLSGEAARDAARLRRLSRSPAVFTAMRQVDAMLARGELRPALRHARGLVRHSDTAEAWLFLGIVRHRLGHDWRAERALRRALVLDNGLAEGHNRLGILLLGKGELENGLGHLRRAEALSPDDPSPKLHLAQACALLGRLDEGQRLLERAERLGANPETVAAIRGRFFAA